MVTLVYFLCIFAIIVTSIEARGVPFSVENAKLKIILQEISEEAFSKRISIDD